MWNILNIEQSPTQLLNGYCRTFAILPPPKRRDKVLSVALQLKEQKLISAEDAPLLDSPEFLRLYAKLDKEIFGELTELFPYLPSDLTRTQAVALLAIKVQSEPFTSYLSQALSREDLRILCDARNRAFPTSGSVARHWRALIIQDLLATRSGDSGLVLQVQTSPLAEELKKLNNDPLRFVPTLSEKTIWEQITITAEFVLKLNAVYAFSPHIVYMSLDRDAADVLFLETTLNLNESVLQYLARTQDNLVSARILKKLTALAETLDNSELLLKNISLSNLKVDRYENVWIVDVRGSYLMKRGNVVSNINKDNGIVTWDLELYVAGLSTFTKDYKPGQASSYNPFISDEEETLEDEEEYTETDDIPYDEIL